MSLELFKCFINDLWEQLISLSVPVLDGAEIWHLFWADDLVLMALDNTSLQKTREILHENCLEWGLTVNISKTAIMVFNRSGRLLNESCSFINGDVKIPSVSEY